jgi:hypothetical protein
MNDLGHALLALGAVVVPLLLAWKLLSWQLLMREQRRKKAPPRPGARPHD